MNLKEGYFQLRNRRAITAVQEIFDARDIFLGNINGTATDLRWEQDTLSVHTDITGGTGNGLELKKLQTDFKFQPQLMEMRNLDLQLANSRIGNYFSMAFKNTDEFNDFINKVQLTGNFKNTVISTADLAYFSSSLRGKNQLIKLDGQVSGTLNNLASPDFRLSVGNTRVNGALSLQNITSASDLYINFNTPGSVFHIADLLPWAPAVGNLSPSIKKALQPLQFRGTFKGGINDFAVNGNLLTPLGAIATNMKLNLDAKTYTGTIGTTNLNLGTLLGVNNVGKLTFNGNLKGRGFGSDAAIDFNGNVQEAFYNDYTYRNVSAGGSLKNLLLKTNLQLADPNLAGNINVEINLKRKTRAYIGSGTLTKANFKTLNLTERDLRFSGTFDVNFTGETIDDFLGYARLYNTHLYNGDVPFSFDSLIVYSAINPEGKKELSLQTNELDASVVGRFNIEGLPNSFQYFLNSYYPALIPKPKSVAKNQDFTFALNAKNIESYLHLVDPKIEGLNNSSITGIINTTDNQIILNATVPYFKYSTLQVSNANFQATGTASKLNLFGTLDEFRVSDSLSFPGVTINVATEDQVSHLQVATSRGGLLNEASINADFTTNNNDLRLKLNPSSFILNNKTWTIDQGGEMLLQNKHLLVNNFTIRQDNQEITLSTVPVAEGSKNEVLVQTRNLNIGDLLPFVLKQPQLEGLATGKFVIADPLGKPAIHVQELRIDQARMNGDSIGVLNIGGNVDLTTGLIKATLQSPNENYRFNADIEANLYDSTGNQINIVLDLQRERLTLLKGYLNTIFDDFDGYATGRLQIKGKAGSPQLIGDIKITGGRIKVLYTQVTYFIDSGTVSMREGYMGFGTMRLRDRFNNTGTLQGGFEHNFFQKMVFNLSVKSDRLELLNTTLKDNQSFYGNAIGRGFYELKGPGTNLTMNISAEPTDSSHIFIPNTTTARDNGEADFIVFKKYGREQVAPKLSESDLHINVDLKANNKTQIDVILDYANNDIITAYGNGKLTINYANNAFTMKGRYDVEKGTYNYNFQSFIRKGFDLAGDGSNYIEWVSGDPLDANLHINAKYQAKSVRFSDLNANNNFSLGNNNLKGDVEVSALITGKLTKPDIDFNIELPRGSQIGNDPTATLALERINKDASERLKQVTYLIVFNQFAPYGEARGVRNAGTDLAVNTISEILSRQLGTILSDVLYQITGDRSLQVDFSTSVYSSSDITNGNVSATGYDRSRVNFKVGKSLANNRIIINVGSDFDFSVRSSAVNSFQFLPDISVEFVLSPNRKLRAILFKRDNLELGSRRNRAGASLSFRQDFDHFFGGKPAGTITLKHPALTDSTHGPVTGSR